MAKTVDNFATIEDFRTTYNELAFDVGDVSGLRDGLKTGNNGTIVDAVNVLEDKQFFFQEFVFVASNNQVEFTGVDSFSNDLIFVKDKIQVFKNERHLIEDVDFIISSPTGTGAFKGITLLGTYASGQSNAMSANDRLHVYSYTGAFVGTNIANAVASFFQKTVEETIYNSNSNGVILNGDSSSPTTLLESGYTIQLAGKTFAEEDIFLTTGKTLTAPTITDSTMSINSGSITGAVNGTFSGFLDIEGNIDVNGTSHLDVVDIDGAVDMASTLQVDSTLTVDGNTDLNANLTVDGNTTLGNTATDNITFTGKAASNLRPNANNTYSLGLSTARWSNVYSQLADVTGTATVGTLTDGTLSITGGDISGVDDITGAVNSVFKSDINQVNEVKDFDGTHTILRTTKDAHDVANRGHLVGTVDTLSNHTTAGLAEGSNLYYTDARVLTKIQATNLTEIKNVTTSALANDDVLLYNGSAWANTNLEERVEDIAGAMFTGNTETGLSVTYNDTSGKTNLVVSDSDFEITGAVTGTATQTAKGNVTIATALTPISLSTLTDATVTSPATDHILVYTSNNKFENTPLAEAVEDVVGGMLGGTETGITVTYQDATNDIDFVLDNSNFALTGKVSGTATQTAKGNVSIATTVNLALSDLPAISLTNLTDATVSTAANNNILVHDGTDFKNIDMVEKVQDIAGAMFTSTNTETGLSVTYNDSTNDIDVVVDNSDFTLTGKVTGTATQTAKGDVTINTLLGSIGINELSDVNTSGANNGQVLGYNASNQWVPVDQSTGSDQVTEGTNNKYFSDNRVADVFQTGSSDSNTRLNKGIKLSYDAKTSGVLDGEIDLELEVGSLGGLSIPTSGTDANKVQLDYSVITDSDLSGGLPSGTGKAIGHLFFLV